MRLMTLGEVIALHRRILAENGGRPGVRDLGAIASAVATAKGFCRWTGCLPNAYRESSCTGLFLGPKSRLVDGNKRVAHAAMEVFLVLNGVEITATIDEQERFILSLAAGEVSRPGLALWLESNTGCLSRES
jgi:death-on-curing protein